MEEREFGSNWRSLQSQKCHQCGKRIPLEAQFGAGKHAVAVRDAIHIYCDDCYDKQIDNIRKTGMVTTKKEMHELSDSEREKLK